MGLEPESPEGRGFFAWDLSGLKPQRAERKHDPAQDDKTATDRCGHREQSLLEDDTIGKVAAKERETKRKTESGDGQKRRAPGLRQDADPKKNRCMGQEHLSNGRQEHGR